MTTTIASTSTTVAEERTGLGPIWRTGAVAGLVAAGATTAIAVAARAADIGLRTTEDEPIPAIGFGQVTVMTVLVGLVLATVLVRKARHPRSTFTRATVGLTVVSCIPSVTMLSGAASITVSVLTHVVAAAIVIPAVRDRLPVEA